MRITFCTRCGGNDLRIGQVRHADQIHFDLADSGRFRRRGLSVPMTVAMCMDCGHIEMRGDVEAIRQLETDDPSQRAVG